MFCRSKKSNSVTSSSIPSTPSSLPTPPESSSTLQILAEVKKPPEKVLTIYNCVWPVYILSRLYGLCPFTIQYTEKGHMENVRVSVFDAIGFILAIGFNCMLLFCLFNTLIFGDTVEITVLFMANRTTLVFALASSTLFIPMDMLNRKRLLKMFKQFHTFDKEV